MFDLYKLLPFNTLKEGEKLLNEYVAYGAWKLFDIKMYGSGGVIVLEKIKAC